MSKDTSTLTLPFSPQVSGTLLLVAGLALASALIYAALGGKDRPDLIIALRERMGLTGLPPGVVFFLCALWPAVCQVAGRHLLRDLQHCPQDRRGY